MKFYNEKTPMNSEISSDTHYPEKNPLNDLEFLRHSRVKWKLMAANGSENPKVLDWLAESENVLIQTAAKRRKEVLLNTAAPDPALKNPSTELRGWFQKNIKS